MSGSGRDPEATARGRGDDAELVRVGERFLAGERAYDEAVERDDEAAQTAVMDEQQRLYELLCRMPARTQRGRQAKARALVAWLPRTPDGIPCPASKAPSYVHLDGLAYALALDTLRGSGEPQ
jgi:hypothetical protein